MRKAKAEKIKDLLLTECKRLGVPYRKIYFRRAKKGYSAIPSKEKQFVGL